MDVEINHRITTQYTVKGKALSETHLLQTTHSKRKNVRMLFCNIVINRTLKYMLCLSV